ncbi:RNA methyltransferase [Vineibacter terrae]|uniref:tRNA (cytidine/uridine-2'-O-)-methyltransferase TrmJ n=1 Tax=Vineibacter terrae TaxID=2586908 RepID=A0A5C8P805_9HYPH|nr:RNA methyltransferase [Vineibacter terrae]TXL69652.1 RNA methyltransferase [Vineibacter terrae]
MGRANKSDIPDAPAPAVVLVRPQLGENIGMAARAMLNCGLGELRLVAPRDGWPNPAAQRASSGADSVLESARVFESVADAVGDMTRVIATTARARELTQRVVNPRRAAEELRQWIAAGERGAVLFGPERTGLQNDDLVHADTVLSIPLNPHFSSLNMAQAVLLVAYEWSQAGAVPDETLVTNTARPATKAELTNLFLHLERELDESGFLRVPEKRPDMVRNIRAMLQRARPTEQEVNTFHGIIAYLATKRRRG